ESGGVELSFSNMLGPRRRMGGRCFRDEGIAAADSPWLKCLPASGLVRLKERLAPAGVFVEISWRCRKSADVRDLGAPTAAQDRDDGANKCACASVAASSMVMNTAPAVDRSFTKPSSPSMP